MAIELMMLASQVSEAEDAQHAGVDRIFFDLEYINKHERQRGLNTVKSNNSIDDLPMIRASVTSSKLLVRTNMINSHLSEEIDQIVDCGADIIMLPMAIDRKDAESFVKYVKGRAKVVVMIETPQALTRVDSILEVEGIDEIFIGLNDLHLGLGVNFMFEVLSGGIVQYLAEKCKSRGIPFGFGGIARIGDGRLPADLILGEHYRLGSSSVILSRTFKGDLHSSDSSKEIMKKEVQKVRDHEIKLQRWTNEDFVYNQLAVTEIVNAISDDLS